jgi:CMP-N-acetylneuraminic acid synthetase
MTALGIIPARGGSKGIPRKNLLPLNGRPLLAYTAEAARGSRHLTRTILSSDSQEIVAEGRRFGLDAPFIRPAALAGDEVGSAAVVAHALQEMERAERTAYDAVVLLEPTAPLRTAEDIDAAIELLDRSGADSVVGVCRVDAPHPMKMQVIEGQRLRPFMPQFWREGMRRQDLPAVFYLNGAVYAVRAAMVRERGSLWGAHTAPLIMPPERSVNIDSLIDLALAEVLLRTASAIG